VSRKGLLPKVGKKTKENFVSISVASCNTCTMSFDLWMSQGGVDIFVLIVHFSNDKWELCHVTMGFFKTVETTKGVLVLQMNDLLVKHGLNLRVLVYVKDQANNLSIMPFTFILIVSCEILGMLVPYVKIFWGKCWQCAMDDTKVCANLTSISIKLAQSIL
jgi:hypothetical protein